MNATVQARLRALSTPDVVDALLKLGATRVVMEGVAAMTGLQGTRVGRARTLRLLPDRADVRQGAPSPANRALYDSIQPGEMLVVDAMGARDKAALGDMMFHRLAARKIEGVVVAGAVRDLPAIKDLQLPVFAMGSWPQAFLGQLRA